MKGKATYIRGGMPHRREILNAVEGDVVGGADEVGQDFAQLFVTVVAVVFEENTR